MTEQAGRDWAFGFGMLDDPICLGMMPRGGRGFELGGSVLE